MNEYKHFKDSLGTDEAFELHTWDEIDRLNNECEDYFIYLGYAVDDECTGYYTVLCGATGYCVLDYHIGSKTELLAPHGIEFMNGNDVITFRASDGTIYSHF